MTDHPTTSTAADQAAEDRTAPTEQTASDTATRDEQTAGDSGTRDEQTAGDSGTRDEQAPQDAGAAMADEGTGEQTAEEQAAASPSSASEPPAAAGADGVGEDFAPDSADNPPQPAGDADGVPVDDEDHLPAGQTALAVGDEVVVDDDTMRRALEAILMVTDEPLPVLTLARAVGRPTGDIAGALAALAAEYTDQGRGFDLREVGGGWRYYTRPEAAPYVERFVLDGQQARLTQAALETLAVVAYKQPVSRARVSAIRGVNVDGVMRTLVARGLVEEAGADTESQATLYRTTTYFLERMGMQSLDDLPELAPYLPEMDDIEEELAAQTLPPATTDSEQTSADPTDNDTAAASSSSDDDAEAAAGSTGEHADPAGTQSADASDDEAADDALTSTPADDTDDAAAGGSAEEADELVPGAGSEGSGEDEDAVVDGYAEDAAEGDSDGEDAHVAGGYAGLAEGAGADAEPADGADVAGETDEGVVAGNGSSNDGLEDDLLTDAEPVDDAADTVNDADEADEADGADAGDVQGGDGGVRYGG